MIAIPTAFPSRKVRLVVQLRQCRLVRVLLQAEEDDCPIKQRLFEYVSITI